MMKSGMIALVLAGMVPGSAYAQERTVDLSDIKTVAGLLLQAGYKAEMKKGKNGDTYIASASNGNEFTVNFYNCKNDTGCGSLELSSWYKKQPYFSAEMANEWNAKKRFLKIAVDGDGDLVEYVYVSTIGRSTYKNFADYIDWFTQMDGSLAIFLREKDEAAKAKAGTAATK